MARKDKGLNPDPSPTPQSNRRDYIRLLLALAGVGALSTGGTEVVKAAHNSDAPFPSGAWGYSPVAGHGESERPSIAELDEAWSETYHHLFQDIDVGSRWYAEKGDTEWDLLPLVWDGLDTPSNDELPAGGTTITQEEDTEQFRIAGVNTGGTLLREARFDWTETELAITTLTFDTAADHDAAIAEKGVHHEQPNDTDFAPAGSVEKGYASFDEGGSELAAYWPLQEDSGTTANDVSGNGHDLSVTGATPGDANGVLGNSTYDFDELDDYLSGTGPDLNSPNDAFTVAMWVYFVNNDNERNDLYDINEDGGFSLNNLAIGQDGSLVSFVGTGSTNNNISGGNVQENTWSHVAVVYDDPMNDWIIYVNGSSVASSTTGGLGNYGTSWEIGRDNDGNDYWAQYLNHIRAYTRGLSGSEIQELYEAAL